MNEMGKTTLTTDIHTKSGVEASPKKRKRRVFTETDDLSRVSNTLDLRRRLHCEAAAISASSSVAPGGWIAGDRRGG